MDNKIKQLTLTAVFITTFLSSASIQAEEVNGVTTLSANFSATLTPPACTAYIEKHGVAVNSINIGGIYRSEFKNNGMIDNSDYSIRIASCGSYAPGLNVSIMAGTFCDGDGFTVAEGQPGYGTAIEVWDNGSYFVESEQQYSCSSPKIFQTDPTLEGVLFNVSLPLKIKLRKVDGIDVSNIIAGDLSIPVVFSVEYQ